MKLERDHLTQLKPCGRCEHELPITRFEHVDDMFCRECTAEVVDIIGKKYNAIEAAIFRAKLRRKTQNLGKSG
jgi:hypothetical protein